MKTVRVTYTVKSAFAEQNQNNIKRVMQDLQLAAHDGIYYTACVNEDGVTFTHLAFFRSEEDQKTLNELLSFKQFQQDLKASGPEIAPKQEHPVFIGSSFPIFNS